MQCPKLLWIKENLPNSWKRFIVLFYYYIYFFNRTKKFFDLADFLTYKVIMFFMINIFYLKGYIR